jgi:hypothetical protein
MYQARRQSPGMQAMLSGNGADTQKPVHQVQIFTDLAVPGQGFIQIYSIHDVKTIDGEAIFFEEFVQVLGRFDRTRVMNDIIEFSGRHEKFPFLLNAWRI